MTEYIYANRQFHEFLLNVRKTLNEGEQAAIRTKIGRIADTNDMTRRVRVTVVSAIVAE